MNMKAKGQAARAGDQAATVLVNRAKAGDRGAFEELVRRYRGRILALALHLSGNESEAEDTTQEVFLKTYQKLDTFEGRSHFFTWVYRMAVNRSLNAKRDRKRRREETIDDPRVARALRVDAAGSDPVKTAELRATYIRLLQALDSLPANMRTSVVLVVLQGFSHAEAAVVLKCSVGTVAWHIHQARNRLRSKMSKGLPREKRPGLSAELTKLLQEWLLPCPQIS